MKEQLDRYICEKRLHHSYAGKCAAALFVGNEMKFVAIYQSIGDAAFSDESLDGRRHVIACVPLPVEM